jgi:hypothetical protein
MADQSQAPAAEPRTLANALRKLLRRNPQGAQSSPSVFDAKQAAEAHKQQLQQALDDHSERY